MEDEREPTDVEEIGFLTEAFVRFREDLDCAANHWEDAKVAAASDDEQEAQEQLYALVKHVENMVLGVGLMHRSIVSRFCSAQVVAQLAIDKLQQQTGSEWDVIATATDGEGGGGFLLQRKETVVPDDISELDGE